LLRKLHLEVEMVGRVAVVEAALAEVDRQTLAAEETLAEEDREAEVEEDRLRIQ